MAQVCPLLIIGNYANGTGEGCDTDCREERCAWWFEPGKRCAVPQIAREIERLADRVQDLNIDFRDQLVNLNQNIFPPK